jgi:1-acyl-sn-glycerol-3-phosphate acyltransferase
VWSRRVLNALIVRPLAWILTRAKITGRENIPTDGSFILMVNHCNFLDPAMAVVSVLPRETVLFTKVENMKVPVLGTLMRWYGAQPVERGEADVEAIKQSIDILSKEDSILLVSPEGTRSYHGRLLPAKDGMAFIAARAGVPVLPVGISGVKDFWLNLKRLRKTHVHVRIGHPFRFRHNGRVPKTALKEMTREAMYQLAALLPPEQWGAYSDMENATEHHLEFLEPGQSNLVYARRERVGRNGIPTLGLGALA